MEHSKLKLSK
jgi:serine/threonine protein kinase